MAMTEHAAVREELAKIVVKGVARGAGESVTLADARRIVAELIASDDSPYWEMIRVGRDQMAAVVARLRPAPLPDPVHDGDLFSRIEASTT